MGQQTCVLTIIGSPRKGNTYSIVRNLESGVSAFNPDVSFEYLFLGDMNVEMCRGCQVCLIKGVEKCPLKDDVPNIFEKLRAADGFILAAPGYNQHVPGIMKNFIDRMSFNCHSPSLYGKNALCIATVGGMGAEQTSKYLKLIATCWGAHVAGTLEVKMDYQEHVAGHKGKTDRAVLKLAREYAEALRSAGKPVPSFKDLLVFASLREETRFSPHFREHWKEMGWADSDYYYKSKINPVTLIAARVMGFIVKKEMDAVFKDK